MISHSRHHAQQTAHESTVREAYAGEKPVPLKEYATTIGVFGSLFTAMTMVAAGRDRLPRSNNWSDLVLLGIATHKLSRILTKDWITSPLRAPFTEYKESLPGGEVNERSRGRGRQRATGDLLTCPYCTGAWVAAALGFGSVFAPRVTRMIGAVFTIEAVSDFLHLAYDKSQREQKAISDGRQRTER